MIEITQRLIIFEKLKTLKADALPVFGKMSPQHMVEHLSFALSFSNGKLPQKLMIDKQTAKTIMHYTINTEHEMTPGFKAPMLGDEPPLLLHGNLLTAISNLKKELEDFDLHFKNNPTSKPICPVIGELDHQQWIIFHNKHFTHHFKQFALT